jgi:hypothetical protein
MKPLIFARRYPDHHQRAQQHTHFVEAILVQLGIDFYKSSYLDLLIELNPGKPLMVLQKFWVNLTYPAGPMYPKSHTIRTTFGIKAGETVTPRVWSGRPYYDCQITFAPPLTICNTWVIQYKPNGEWYMPKAQASTIIETIANNDGLDLTDLQGWFNKPLHGQIICWNPDIQY